MNSIVAFMKQLVGSVAHPEFYREAIQRSVGKALIYLLLLYTCVYTVIGLKIYVDTNQVIDALAVTVQTKVPDFVLQNATLTVHDKMPYVIEDNAQDHSFAVIDTSGKLDEGVLAKYDHGCFVAAHKLVVKVDAQQTFTYDFANMQGGKLVKQDIVDCLPVIKYFLAPGILLVLFVTGYIGQLITCWMLAILGSLIAGIMKFPMRFVDVFKIEIYSFSMPLILSVPVALFGPAVLPTRFGEALWLFYYVFYHGVPIVYLFTIVQFLRDRQQQ